MGFQQGLSGLNISSKSLEVIGNNVANANTYGAKAARAEFADMYAASLSGGGNNNIGIGARIGAVAQQFTQGNINQTGNSLDLAINGNGFFALSAQGQMMYTRAGEFGTDKDGYIQNSSGFRLQGYEVGVGGQILQGKKTDLRVDTSNVSPKATSLVNETINLDSTASIIDPAVHPFNPGDPETFNWSTSVPVYDSLGNVHTMTQYFAKRAGNEWDMMTLIDGRNPANPASTDWAGITLNFDSAGKLATSTPSLTNPGFTVNAGGSFSLNSWQPAELQADGVTWAGNNAAVVTDMGIDLSKTTQFNAVSAVTSQNQDGYATGQLSGLNIDETGNMFAAFTNGQSKLIGQVMLVNFSNPQGLKPVGGTAWVETYASGVPIEGMAKTGTFGAIQAGALEESNVDLTAQLVQLIKAQSNYQANAKTVTTQTTVMQTTINMT